jgi:predicted nucleotidyltransferase
LDDAGYTRGMDRADQLQTLCKEFGLLSVYLFGSRAEDGVRRLERRDVTGEGSDLDVGVFGNAGAVAARRLGALQVALEEVFAPLRVDLVPLDRVDPLFQFAAVRGERIAAPDTTAADEKELEVMRRAADLLPFQRELEREEFGVATS